MVAIGEQSGKVDEALQKVQNIFYLKPTSASVTTKILMY
jgi:type II secretory pathway component PulF